MLDKFTNDDNKKDFASAFVDGTKCRIDACEAYGGQLAGSRPDEITRRRRLHPEATARVPMRIKRELGIRRTGSRFGVYAPKSKVEWLARWGCSIALLGLMLSAPGGLLCGSPNGNQPTNLSARDLVKDVTHKEEIARKNPQNYYKFVQEEKSPDSTKTSIRIETPAGEIGEVVSVNGKPPSQAECRKDADSLKKVASDPKVQQRQARDQQEQSDRIDKLMAAVPEAFIFKYQGKQQNGKWIVIKFRPNPDFQPQSHEAALLTGMRGTLWVDSASHRLAKIDGTLIKDVNFGWGFLASLHRGGHFEMQQSVVPGGSWKQTFLGVDLDGSKMVFGQLHVHFTDSSQSYVRLDDPGTLAGAVNMLEHSPIACSESQGTATSDQAEIR